MASTAQLTDEQIVARLSQDFLIDAGERIAMIEKVLGTGGGPDPDAVMTIRREAHNIKGTGGTFGFPVIGLIAHRLEDYMSGLDAFDERHVSDVHVFVDRMMDIVEAGRDPDDSAAEALVRGLPAHPGADIELADALGLEVLLVSPSKTISLATMKTLRARGCRVTTARTALQAIEIAVQTRPDLIITSTVMDGVSGHDLVRALGVITATQGLPVAVLTSFSKTHADLEQFPSTVPVIRLGDSFDGDLAEAITRLGLD